MKNKKQNNMMNRGSGRRREEKIKPRRTRNEKQRKIRK